MMKRILPILLLLALMGCKTRTVYVPQDRVRVDSVYFNTVKTDSVLIHDSVSVLQKGDTVWQYRYRYKYVYKDRVDTVYIAQRDTVTVTVPVEAEGVKLTWWERIRLTLYGFAATLVLYAIGYWIYKKVRK